MDESIKIITLDKQIMVLYANSMESLEHMIDERITWGDLKTALAIKWVNLALNDGSTDKLDAVGRALEYQVAGAKGVYRIDRRQEWR